MIFKAHGAVHVCVREMVKKNVVLLIIDATCDMKRRSHLLHVLQHDDTDTDTDTRHARGCSDAHA